MTIVIEISIICDDCYNGIETGCFTEEEAEQYGIEKGWAAIGKFHYCPNCKDQARPETTEARIHKLLRKGLL